MIGCIMGDVSPHLSVLYHEVLDALQPRKGGRYVDGTLGAGGHAAGILEASSPDGLLLGLDVDPQALSLARQRLSEYGPRAHIVQASYITLREQLAAIHWPDVKGILLDLGASSMQFDTPERGFSFQVDAPLDMRFDPQNPTRAADLVNNLPEKELADLIFQYGEERHARQVARAIVRARPLYTTGQLAEVVAAAVTRGRGKSRDHLHPATRTFQALRIVVNKELEALQACLPQAVAALSPGGRLAIIAFHSLEDRIVKQYFRRESRDCICPPDQPVCTCGHRAILKEITRRPLRPQDEEIERNPRSRSARLRVAEKLI
jgi:16S rRNA (cytosine1402-N4)-methyltransferase